MRKLLSVLAALSLPIIAGLTAAGCVVSTGPNEPRIEMSQIELSIIGRISVPGSRVEADCRGIEIEASYPQGQPISFGPIDGHKYASTGCSYQLGRTPDEVNSGKGTDHMLIVDNIPGIGDFLKGAEGDNSMPKIRVKFEGAWIEGQVEFRALQSQTVTRNGSTSTVKTMVFSTSSTVQKAN